MGKSTKILLCTLGVVIVLGAGVYLYLRKYGDVGANATAANNIYMTNSTPRNRGSVIAGNRSIDMNFSANISAKLNREDFTITESSTENGIKQLELDQFIKTNKEITTSITDVFKANSVYIVDVNSQDSSVPDYSFSFYCPGDKLVTPTINQFGSSIAASSSSAGLYLFRLYDTAGNEVKRSSGVAQGYYIGEWAKRYEYGVSSGKKVQLMSSFSSSLPSGKYSARFKIQTDAGDTPAAGWAKKDVSLIKPLLLVASVTGSTARFTSDPIVDPNGVPYANKVVHVTVQDSQGVFSTKDLTTNANGILKITDVNIGATPANIMIIALIDGAQFGNTDPFTIINSTYAVNF